MTQERIDELCAECVRYMKHGGKRTAHFARNLYSALTEIERLQSSLSELHSWRGLMSLLGEHWPEDIFPTLVDDLVRDAGARIVSLIRWVDRLKLSQATKHEDGIQHGLLLAFRKVDEERAKCDPDTQDAYDYGRSNGLAVATNLIKNAMSEKTRNIAEPESQAEVERVAFNRGVEAARLTCMERATDHALIFNQLEAEKCASAISRLIQPEPQPQEVTNG